MVGEYFAHSPKDEIPAQSYECHIWGVLEQATAFANAAGYYAAFDGMLLSQLLRPSAIYHDVGKLCAENQAVLSGNVFARALPVNHVDAGTAYLLSGDRPLLLAATAVLAHHKGFPDFTAEQDREDLAFRDEKIKLWTDEALPELMQVHHTIIKDKPDLENSMPHGDKSVFLRLLLSCLSDADHTDTSVHYGTYPEDEQLIALRPRERLAQLDKYVTGLGDSSGDCGERDRLRTELYSACKNADVEVNIVSSDAPVGSGKTTAIMANLLAQAHKRGLRRIIVVLPFTNIIQQSVDTYRKALVLPEEKAVKKEQEVVAELHHRADFESEDIRHLTALWRAPIIVTTAVAFFETLASNSPSTLRRLHELPGSAIFVDEAHAALPAKLLPLAWRWINIYANEWSCYWVLASGSLSRFWEIREISTAQIDVPEIVPDSLRASLDRYESNRISYRHNLRPKSIVEFSDWLSGFAGPRLVVVNTVQSAAVIARHLCKKYGQECVEHLSTALLSKDRARTLARVKERLDNKEHDHGWTLVATSCVETGVNLSFRNGFRELASLTSLIQAAGRVRRNGEHENAEMWTFCLAENYLLKQNPSIASAASVLHRYLDDDVIIKPSLATDAISREIKLYGIDSMYTKLLDRESVQGFQYVDEKFNVIESDTRVAVVEESIAQKIRSRQVDWHTLQQNSVQIAKYKLDELCAPPIADGIYYWNCGYDDFLGYMVGVIQSNEYEKGVLII
jgi:CRISPR-associated endonuclease/helicase Cas3